MKKIAVLPAFTFLLASVVAVSAEEPPHLDFVRGLRSRGMSDLALQYLERLKKSPPKDIAAVLPLEFAKTRLELAAAEPDAARKAALFSQARAEFEAFVKANATHPLAAEAHLEIARSIAMQGKAQLSKALRQENKNAKDVESAQALKLFTDAAAKFQDASKQIDAQLAKLESPSTDEERVAKRALTQAKLQAQYELGVNLMDQSAAAPDLVQRGDIIEKAIASLKKMSNLDPRNPLCWKARALIVKAYTDIDKPQEARKELRAVIEEEGAHADEARRLARFYRIALIPSDISNKNIEQATQAAAEEWLRLYPGFTNSPEGTAVRWDLANALLKQGLKYKKVGPKGQEKLPQPAVDLLSRAQKLFKALEDSENEYTEKARTSKVQIMIAVAEDRFGAAAKSGTGMDFTKLKDFEEAFLWAQYEAYQIQEDEKKRDDFLKKLPPEPLQKQKDELEMMNKKLETGRKLHVENVISSLHRALEMVDEKVPAAEVIDARAMLAYAYLNAGDPYRAAVLGEHIARTEAGSNRAPAAAAYALQAYAQVLADDEKAKSPEVEQAADRARVRSLAHYMEATWPTEAATDMARHQMATILLREGQSLQAIEVLRRITPAYGNLTHSKYQLALTLLELAKEKDDERREPRPKPAANAPQLTEADKKKFQAEAAQALESIPEASEAADSDTLQVYLMAKCQYGQILYNAQKFDDLEKLALTLQKRVDSPRLEKSEFKGKIAAAVEALSLFAIFGRADDAFKKQDFKRVLELTKPVVENSIGGKNPSMARVLQGLALRANVQEGKTDEAKKILDQLQAAATDDLSGGATGILVQLVAQLREQIEELKKQGEKSKVLLDKTVTSFGAFLDTLAKQPNLNAQTTLFLAHSYDSLEKHAQAAEMLGKVAAPKSDVKPVEGQPDPQQLYRAVRVMYVKQLRLAKQVDKAKEALAEILGSEKEPGWGVKNLDAQKERIYLLQEQEMYFGPKGAREGWNSMMKELQKRIQDTAIRREYFECYANLVYCTFKMATKLDDPKKKQNAIERAAKLIINLENAQQDVGGEDSKKRFEKLLRDEPLLREKYLELGGTKCVPENEQKKEEKPVEKAEK